MELRKPVGENPYFTDVTDADRATVRKALDEPTTAPVFTGATLKLYLLGLKGATEYSTGVPVVRRTTRNAGALARGTAWVRAAPPVTIPGSWEWLKTADRRNKVGADVQRYEEWTGAKEWDDDLYRHDPAPAQPRPRLSDPRLGTPRPRDTRPPAGERRTRTPAPRDQPAA